MPLYCTTPADFINPILPQYKQDISFYDLKTEIHRVINASLTLLQSSLVDDLVEFILIHGC